MCEADTVCITTPPTSQRDGSNGVPRNRSYSTFGDVTIVDRSISPVDYTEIVDYCPQDFVELHNLTDNALNGQKGTVINELSNGRIRVRLGIHLMARIVSVKAENVRMVHTRATIEEIQKRRDQGQSVSVLLADGFSVGAIQRDDSEKLCSDCCRPRVMCSCTYGIKE